MVSLLLLLALILMNGLFAMSEIALISSRRARLAQRAEAGSAGARRALVLAADPTRFLSSVQVGITSIGILNGAIGEAAIVEPLQARLATVPALAPYAEGLALVTMVVGLTYVSLILGELVPKRLALAHPEAFAAVLAAPVDAVARLARPLVRVLSVTTDALVKIAGLNQTKMPGVTVDEVRLMLEQGAEEGVFEPSEREMVSNVLRLDERHVGGALTPRADVQYVEVRAPGEVVRATLRASTHVVLPLCDGGLDHVVGFIRPAQVLDRMVDGAMPDLTALAEPALFVPETMTMMTLLEHFKRTHLPVALVVDEFGGVEGLISVTDVFTEIVGDLPAMPGQEPLVVERADGGWLVDGSTSLEHLADTLDCPTLLASEAARRSHTLGGFAMDALGAIPRVGDTFEESGFRFEVVDMDGRRVDRLLVSRLPATTAKDAPPPRP